MTATTTARALPLGSTQRSGVHLTFGPISVAVSVLTSIAEDKDASMRLVCTADHGVKDLGADGTVLRPMSRVTVCPECGDDTHMGRAKEVGDGLVVVPPAVLEAAEAADKAFYFEIVLTPHPMAQVLEQSRATGARYYLDVKASRSNNYALLRDLVLSAPNTAFMTRFAMKTSALPYMLVVDGDTLALVQMADPTLLKARPVVDGITNQAYLDLALTLAAQEMVAYNPADYVRPKSAVIADYVEGRAPTTFAVEGRVAGEVGDLLDALKASVAASAKKRTTTAKTKPAAKPVTQKKSTTKKAAAPKPRAARTKAS